mmetsp:Transcript_1953/g.3649  ORF Transcript_1953/g.3649 Transcript_1953/m.3649 type:complete len:451 (+) Transcript_1953:60-1412(+)
MVDSAQQEIAITSKSSSPTAMPSPTNLKVRRPAKCLEPVLRLMMTVSIDSGMFCAGLAFAMAGPTLIKLAEQLSVPFASAASIFTFRGFGCLAGSMMSGELVDRTGNPAAVMLAPIAAAAAGALAIPYLRSFWAACVMFTFQGLALGMLDAAGNVLILQIWRGSKFQNGHMHALHFFFGLGSALAPLFVSAWESSGLQATSAWLVVAAASIFPLLGFLFLACISKYEDTSRYEEEEAQKALASVVGSKAVLLSAIFLFVYMGAETSFGGLISSYAQQWLHANQTMSAWLASVYWGALCLGRVVAALATSHIHHARYIFAHLVLAVFAASALIPSAMVPKADGYLVVLATGAFGLAIAPLYPGMILVAEEILAAPLSGRAASIILTSAAFGEMVLPAGIAWLFESTKASFVWVQLGLSCCTLVIFTIGSGRLLVTQTSVSTSTSEEGTAEP